MSGRTGTRRAQVLLALTTEHQSLARLAAATGLNFVAVSDICKGLMKAGLAWPSVSSIQPGVALTTAPHVEAARQEAQALVADRLTWKPLRDVVVRPGAKHCTSCTVALVRLPEQGYAHCPGGSTCAQGLTVDMARQIERVQP